MFSTSVSTSHYHGYFINWAGNVIVSSLYYLALAHALIVFIKFIASCCSISLYAVRSSSPPAGVQFNGLFFNENDMIFTACPQRWLFQYSMCWSLSPCPFVSPRAILARTWVSQALAGWALACLIPTSSHLCCGSLSSLPLQFVWLSCQRLYVCCALKLCKYQFGCWCSVVQSVSPRLLGVCFVGRSNNVGFLSNSGLFWRYVCPSRGLPCGRFYSLLP